MDCSSCPHGRKIKRLWSCGWIPAHERSGAGPVPGAYPYDRPDVCPGYLIQLPQVIEAARANIWREKGALREFYDGEPITDLAKQSIDLISAASREVENHNIRAAHGGDK